MEERMIFGRKKESVVIDSAVERRIFLAERLLAETRERMKRGGTGSVMTYHMQLVNDCDALSRSIASLKKGKATEKKCHDLEQAYMCLKTTSENIMNWKFDEGTE